MRATVPPFLLASGQPVRTLPLPMRKSQKRLRRPVPLVQSILRGTESVFEQAFIELKQERVLARSKAQIFVSAWQGAVVVARAGRGIRHIQTIFRELRSMVPLSAEQHHSR